MMNLAWQTIGESMQRGLSGIRNRLWWALAVIYLLSGVYLVAPEQQAVVLRFGRVAQQRVPPGIHWHLPFPLERAVKLKALETKRLTVGVELPDQVLGRAANETPAQYLSGDQNIIQVQLAVQYQIKDAADYLFNTPESPRLIARAVEAAFAQTVAAEQVDNILTTGKIAAQNATYKSAQALLDQYQSGVFLSAINIEKITPPAEVADAFRDVASARADRDRIANEAYGYANDLVAKAQGEAEKLRQDAAGYRQQRINEAQGEAERFTKLLDESRKARGVTEQRLYLEAMEEVLPKIKKVIVDSRGPHSLMDLGIIRSSPGQSQNPN